MKIRQPALRALDYETRRLLKRPVSQKRFARRDDDVRRTSPRVPTLYERVVEYELGAQIMQRLLLAYPHEPNVRAHAMIAADILLWLESIGAPLKRLPSETAGSAAGSPWTREGEDPQTPRGGSGPNPDPRTPRRGSTKRPGSETGSTAQPAQRSLRAP